MTYTSGITAGDGGTNSNTGLFGTPVNNAILDPMQGFDADVWVIDQATGNYNLVGRFTSIQFTVRNATEPYLELNQRVPRLLDGEFQFGWVIERGMLDARVLEQTFGYNAITRELRNNRNVRFQISFSVAAPELQNSGKVVADGIALSKYGNRGDGSGIAGASSQSAAIANSTFSERSAVGEYVLTFCKVDSFTLGINAGRNVIANRWEGMCEGIEYVNRSRVDPGVFLTSQNAGTALLLGSQSAQYINPFPWDNVLYTANSTQTQAGSASRTANPLGTAWGGQLEGDINTQTSNQ